MIRKVQTTIQCRTKFHITINMIAYKKMINEWHSISTFTDISIRCCITTVIITQSKISWTIPSNRALTAVYSSAAVWPRLDMAVARSNFGSSARKFCGSLVGSSRKMQLIFWHITSMPLPVTHNFSNPVPERTIKCCGSGAYSRFQVRGREVRSLGSGGFRPGPSDVLTDSNLYCL